jgi:hypothetical protein
MVSLWLTPSWALLRCRSSIPTIMSFLSLYPYAQSSNILGKWLQLYLLRHTLLDAPTQISNNRHQLPSQLQPRTSRRRATQCSTILQLVQLRPLLQQYITFKHQYRLRSVQPTLLLPISPHRHRAQPSADSTIHQKPKLNGHRPSLVLAPSLGGDRPILHLQRPMRTELR